VGLRVLQSPNGGEVTVIRFAREKKTLSIDTLHASKLRGLKPRTPETAPFELAKAEPLELRIFVDRSIIEVFANGRRFLGLRVYPTRGDARGVSLFSTGGDAELASLQAWHMRSVWPELKGKEGK
jgi:beta-fructofuranosidase